MKNELRFFAETTLNSYTQVFFSKNKWLGLCLVVVTFLDPWAGLSGLTAVVFSAGVAKLLAFNPHQIREGLYSFNSLLVGLGLGYFYEPGWIFFALLISSALLALMLSLSSEAVLGKYGLPFLSIPFLLVIWGVLAASGNFGNLHINIRGAYRLNEFFAIGGDWLLHWIYWWEELSIPLFPGVFFKSLSAIFFQYNIPAGVLIAVGLLVWSRIAFLTALTSFTCAYLFYNFSGGDFNDFHYAYIGFNYILAGIALGAFFIVPSLGSFLLIIILVPVLTIAGSSTSVFLAKFNLPVFSLPFNLITILSLHFLKLRFRQKPLTLTGVQYFSPEKNLYYHLNSLERYAKSVWVAFQLPFFGSWKVSQGHSGTITHKEDWKYAWDFVIEDETGKTYAYPGTRQSDYYCYNKPVLAPADGYVQAILDNIADNEIGEVNLQQNWGNSIVIKHAEGLFSQLSHLKEGSFQVKVGDFVRKGEIIARLGNSGRSPEPHLHLQFQASHHIGAPTLDYPLGYYLLRENNSSRFQEFERPKEGQEVANIEVASIMKQAFNWIPGKVLVLNVEGPSSGKVAGRHEWEICADAWNKTYLRCKKTGSLAWFQNDGILFRFTAFEGDHSSLLYLFYLGCYRMLLGPSDGIFLTDPIPVTDLTPPPIRLIQDLVAPFFLFVKAGFKLQFLLENFEFQPTKIVALTTAEVRVTGVQLKKLDFKLKVEKGFPLKFEITSNGNTWVATWESA